MKSKAGWLNYRKTNRIIWPPISSIYGIGAMLCYARKSPPASIIKALTTGFQLTGCENTGRTELATLQGIGHN